MINPDQISSAFKFLAIVLLIYAVLAGEVLGYDKFSRVTSKIAVVLSIICGALAVLTRPTADNIESL